MRPIPHTCGNIGANKADLDCFSLIPFYAPPPFSPLPFPSLSAVPGLLGPGPCLLSPFPTTDKLRREKGSEGGKGGIPLPPNSPFPPPPKFPPQIQIYHFHCPKFPTQYFRHFPKMFGPLLPSSFLSAPFLIIWLLPSQITTSLSSSHQSKVPFDVDLQMGRLRGFESIFLHKRVRSFLGIPFAEPPLGEFRFRPPQRKKPWNGTIEASTLSPACIQGRDTYNESFWGSEMWNANTPVSEDCLYMNIWAPADAKNLTVMVWFFGGGFYYGSPSLVLYDGKALALTANVIVVNINYRLGPFGYLYLINQEGDEEVPGNMGMLDQQLALHWIQENIEAFGGNPKSVTIFGESAGASSIVAHLIAPGSRGLFQNGILQSGSLDNKWSMDTPKRALEKSMEMVRLVGCNRTNFRESIRCLRRVPAMEFTEQLWNIQLNFLEFPLVIVSKDPNFFTKEDAFISLRNKNFAQDVNLMIGINHDEGTFWNIYNIPKFFDVPEQPQLNLNDFHECTNTAFVRLPEIVRDAATHVYLGNRCDYQSGQHRFLADQINQMVGDYFFTCDSLWLADQLDDSPARVFIYYFDEASSANPWPKWTGVMHGYEIEFVFGVPLYNTSAGYTNRERILSKKMIQLWSSFAINGIPSLHHHDHREEQRLHWPQYHSQNNPRWLHLKASHLKPMHATKRAECRVWRAARDMEYNEYVLEKLSAAMAGGAANGVREIGFVWLIFIWIFPSLIAAKLFR